LEADETIKEETLKYQSIKANNKKSLDGGMAEWRECRITLTKRQFSIQVKFPFILYEKLIREKG
jgi:hypothetical protein